MTFVLCGGIKTSMPPPAVEPAVEHQRVQAAFNERGQAALEHYQRTGISHCAEEVVAGLQAKLDRKRRQLRE